MESPTIILSNSNDQICQQKIKHGVWSFDYNQLSNRYSVDVESCENHEFNHTMIDSNKPNNTELDDFRRAALIHKIARKKALLFLHSGGKLADLVDGVEMIILKMCNQDPKTYYSNGSISTNSAGIAFPVGVNINNVIAHDSKYMTRSGKCDDREFYKGDVVKIDIGVHINGRIIDSAFTHIVTDKPGVHDIESIYNSVLDASKDSMFNAIKLAGPDQRLVEISETISEIIESYEVNIGDNTNLPIKPVIGIGGHNIQHYKIHGDKLILSKPNYEIQQDQRMEEDEIYAIETYATTGEGIMTQNEHINTCTHFMQSYSNDLTKATKKDKKNFEKTELYDWIKSRNGLPFSSSWIDVSKVHKVDKAFKLGISTGQLQAYPPLYDTADSVVAQFEHTIHIGSNSVEIFSIGEDF